MDRYEIATSTIYLIVLKISSDLYSSFVHPIFRLFANAATEIVEYFAWSDFRANYYFITLISISHVRLIYTKYYVRRKYFKLINAFVVYIAFVI